MPSAPFSTSTTICTNCSTMLGALSSAASALCAGCKYTDTIQTSRISKFQMEKTLPGAQVSRRHPVATIQGPLTQLIAAAVAPGWQEHTIAQRTRDYVYQCKESTSGFRDSFRSSTPTPGDDNELRKSRSTRRISPCDSDRAATRRVEELEEALKQQAIQIATLQDEAHVSGERYSVLEDKYAKQIAQRKGDKEKVDNAWAYYQDAEEGCDQLKARIRDLEEEKSTAAEQHEAQMQTKDRELAHMKEDYDCAILALANAHEEELAHMKESHDCAIFTLESAHENDMKTKAEAAKEAKLAAQEAMDTLRGVLDTTEKNRKAWSEEKEELNTKVQLITADTEDALQSQKDEIVHLVTTKGLLEKQVELLILQQQGRGVNDDFLEKVFENISSVQQTFDDMRTKIVVLEEKVENVPESMQQERDHWNRQGAKEKEAQAEVAVLLPKIEELETKLMARDNLLRQIDEAGMKATSASKSSKAKLSVVSDSIVLLVAENDELRKQIAIVQAEKAKDQSHANKFDDENLRMAMQIGELEELIHEKSKDFARMEQLHKSAESELQFLTDAHHNGGQFSSRAQEELREHLRKTTIDIQTANAKLAEMEAELTKHRELIELVEDKADIEVMEAAKDAEYWWDKYYDEAVHKVESMYEEIYRLNAELGRDIRPKEQPVRNQKVADRAALRTACRYGADSHNVAALPEEYFEPEFVPGEFPATADAMRVLRPAGWKVVYEMGKAWLEPEFKAFREADGEARRLAVEFLRAEAARTEEAERAAHNAPSPIRMQSSQRAAPVTMKRVTHKTRRTPAPKPAPLVPIDTTQPPPAYDFRFASFMDMTRANYEELDDDNRWEFFMRFEQQK